MAMLEIMFMMIDITKLVPNVNHQYPLVYFRGEMCFTAQHIILERNMYIAITFLSEKIMPLVALKVPVKNQFLALELLLVIKLRAHQMRDDCIIKFICHTQRSVITSSCGLVECASKNSDSPIR